MKRSKHSDWQRDVQERQRNVVFPSTAANEARLWRNLLTRKQKLGFALITGLVLMSLTLAAAFYALVSNQLRISPSHGNLLERLFSEFGVWIILVLVGAALLIVGQIASKRANRARAHSRKRPT